MEIAIGSMSPIKTQAVIAACEALKLSVTITPVAVSSFVSAQPIGRVETTQGARNRARGAHDRAPESFSIGIENGLRENAAGWEDWAVIVIVCPDGKEVVTDSDPIMMPTKVVDIARGRGFKNTTAGQIMAEQTGCDPNDPHHFLTDGSISRLTLLTNALKIAFQKVLPTINV